MKSLLFTFALAAFAAPSTATPRTSAHFVADETIEQMVDRGRALLENDKTEEALVVLQAASKQDGEKLRTRIWVLRARMALGKVDDALLEIDELKHDGATGPDLDYLYGFGFYCMAKRAVAEGQQSGFIGQQFSDAMAQLSKATAANGDRYRDAFVALADAAYYVPDLAVARKAADRAIVAQPRLGDAWFVRGQICMAQFIGAKDDAAKRSDADAHWKSACESFEKAASTFGAKSDSLSRAKRIQAELELGGAYVWKQDKESAANAYSAAITTDPAQVDFKRIYDAVGGDSFLAIVKTAKSRFHSTLETSTGDGALAWWLGWAEFDRKHYPAAISAFGDAIERKFGAVTAKYYLFKSHYGVQDYAAAIVALAEYCDADPEGSIATLAADQDANLATIEFLIGFEADGTKHAKGEPMDAEAAMLSEICTRIAPTEARYWNNVGLFVRDQGDTLKKTKPETDKAVFDKLWARAYAAYSKALELAPDDPNYLNDTAVMLDYYLDRELDRAMALYEKSLANATTMLEKKGLDAQKRQDLETAKRDSANNIARLKKRLEKKSGDPVKSADGSH